MNYDKAVNEASTKLKQADAGNWDVARLTFDVCGPSGNRGRTPKDVTLEQWAKDVRERSGRPFSTTTASLYRRIWEQFGFQTAESQISWTEAYAEISGGTAAERFPRADFNRAIANGTPEVKREAFTRLANDPDVATDPNTVAHVMAAPDLSRTMRQVDRTQQHNLRDDIDAADQADPMRKTLAEGQALLELNRVLRTCAVGLEEVIPRLGARTPSGTSDVEGGLLRRNLQRVKEGVTAVEHYLDTGMTDLDAFLGSVLTSD